MKKRKLFLVNTHGFSSMRQGFILFLGLLLSIGAFAQRSVSGQVTNAVTGDGIAGVTVQVKGTTGGAFTDQNGRYSVTVPDNNAILIFSFLGFSSQEIPVGDKTTIGVSLTEVALTTDEVVITALGIERDKKELTYAVQDVDTEELALARDLNVVNSLSGKVAGISISRSGSGVGAASRVILRGNRSIIGNSQPLYVVDGVPILGDITDVNPDDIAEVSVLKGPNAAALYGNRANNGAIIITTKRGAAGGFNISLSSTLMAEIPIFLRNYQNEYGQGSAGQYSPASEKSWGPRLDGSSVPHWSQDPNWPTPTYSYAAQPSNVEDFFRTGHNWATNLAISTGNANTQTYFSYTYVDAGGVVPTNDLTRHNVHLRVTNKLADRLTLDAKLNYIREDIDNQLAQGENFTNPIRHAFRLPRNIRTEDVSIFEYTDAAGNSRQHFWNPGSNGGANPYWPINRNLRENTVDRVIAFASLKYEISNNLSITGRAAFDRLHAASEERLFNDTYIAADNGRFNLGRSESAELNTDLLLNYNNDFSENFSLDVSLGGNIRIERNSSLSANTGPGLTVPNFFALGNTQNVAASHGVGAPREVHSVYGFATLGFLGGIFLDVTARNDWSSTLPSDNWSFFYPSVGLNVVLSDLVELPTAISFAKVRASFAEVGNDTQPYQLQRTAGLSAGGANGFLTLSSTLPNENLLPEETRSIEIGADLRFADSRIGLDFTWYRSNTINQLFTVGLPVGSGASQFFTNGGDVQNQGIEAVLTLTPVRTNDFNWDLILNFTRNRSEVIEINDERPRVSLGSDFLREYFVEQGEVFGNVYSRGFERDDQGRVLIGSDGLPLATPGRTVLSANYNPDWLAGIRNVINFKDIYFSFLIDIRQGGSVTSLTDAILFGDGQLEETLPGREGGAIFGQNFFEGETAILETGEANNLTMDVEAFWNKFGGRNAPAGEVFSYDASNVRLRELVLGYKLPLQNLPLKSINFSIVGRNLFFFSNAAETLDPEVIVGTGTAAEGFESFSPPTARSFGGSIRLNF